MTSLACNYVHSISDTWAHLIKLSSAAARKKVETNVVDAWKSSIGICNPLLKVTDTVCSDPERNTTNITFAIETDVKCGVSQTAVLMLALDSFMSLVASSDCASVVSDKERSTFVVKVPHNVSGEILLNNNGFPAGLCGPFKRWSLSFKSADLSGKSGIAGLAGSALANPNDGFDVNGTGLVERMNSITAAARQLDDSEMGRMLSQNRRQGAGPRFSVCSTPQTNQVDALKYQKLYMKARTRATVAIEEDGTGDVTTHTKTPARKRSRRKGDCSANPLSFVDKFAGSGRSWGLKCVGHPGPSPEFTSLFLTGAEADACYHSCLSMRGASRVKSLLNKYGHKDLMKENPEGNAWVWSSPEDRKFIVVFEDGTERHITFRLVCGRSKLFDAVSTMASNIKQWASVTSKFLEDLHQLKEFLPKMGSAATHIRANLLMTLAGVFTLRDTVCFRIPDRCKIWIPKTWNAPMSAMGITSSRYDKIIEVIDLLVTGGAFVSSCLNNAYFYERGVKPRNGIARTWLHIDMLKLATTVLRHACNRIDKTSSSSFHCLSSPSAAPIIITEDGIKHNTSATANQPPAPTRQSIDATIASAIQNFSDLSSSLRRKGIQKCLSEKGKASLDDIISRLGALQALRETTVVTTAVPTASSSCSIANRNSNSFGGCRSSGGGSQRKRKRILQEGEEENVESDEEFEDMKDNQQWRKQCQVRREEEAEESVYQSNEFGYGSMPKRSQLRIEAVRKSAAVAALVLTRHSMDNAMSLKLGERPSIVSSFLTS